MEQLQASGESLTHLLLVDDVDACLDVREGVRCGQDGLAFELFMQVAVSASVQSERCAVHKTSQVVVLVKVGDAVLHFVRVKVRLDICDLDESLWKRHISFKHDP